jgi:hypothetical protein
MNDDTISADDQMRLINAYYIPWQGLMKILYSHGLPLTATHEDAVEWLKRRLGLAQQVMAALDGHRDLLQRVGALEEREYGR